MRFARFAPLALAALLLGLTACEDPSNVGIGLIGETGGTPETLRLDPTTFAPVPARDVTGNQGRVLAGRVADPLLGTLSANAYLDVTSRSKSFGTAAIDAASLRLRRSYLYGDSTATLTLVVRSMPASWDASLAQSDTTLQPGAEVARYTIAPTDTVFNLPLPTAWISTYGPILRDTSFVNAFHGFELSVSSGGAVVGFDAAKSQLRTVTGADTITFAFGKTLTTIRRAGTPTLPPGTVLLQDGTGPELEVDLDLAAAGLGPVAVNRARLRLTADTLTLEQGTPPGFVRPRLNAFQLVGETATGGEVLLSTNVFVDADGHVDFASNDLRRLLQERALGTSSIRRLFVRVPPALVSVNPILFYDTTRTERAPAYFLTLTRLSR